MDGEVVAGEDVVVVDGREFSPRYRVNNIRKKVLPTRILFDHKFSSKTLVFGVDSEIASGDVALGAGEKEDVGTFGVVLNMRYNLTQLLNIRRLQVHQVKSQIVVFNVPEVDAQVVGGDEVFRVGGTGHGVDVVVVAELILGPLHTFIPLIQHLTLRHDYLPILPNTSLTHFPVDLIVKFPELDDSVVCSEHLERVRVMIDELDSIDFFV